ncbi:leukocyte elastase inhibitor [Culex quinquefasciatus]|uniref:leukocyte elastase inhibitor n=1 Tax=Culex quinquefasciatus TaxID=7176 RepID=UPI0018E2E4E5|nr:leukocyte elastase inhibitor [Culex quinquefasciatus]
MLILVVFTQIMGTCYGNYNQFELSLFRTIYGSSKESNIILSAFSIRATLSILYLLANKNTSEDMQKLFKTNHFDRQPFEDGINLQIYSKAFIDQTLFNENFSTTFQKHSGITLETIDFEPPRHENNSIDTWIDDLTECTEPPLLSTTEVTLNSSFLLWSAIWVRARWREPFDWTTQQIFHYANGDHLVDMMFVENRFEHAEVDGLSAVNLPLDADLSMLVIVPTRKSDQLSTVIARFDHTMCLKIVRALKEKHVVLRMPKFAVSSTVDVRKVLAAIGLGALLGDYAFEVAPGVNSPLSSMKQTTVIEVTENGLMGEDSAGPNFRFSTGAESSPSPVFLTIDRPFIFFIRHVSTKSILFIGQYSQFVEC